MTHFQVGSEGRTESAWGRMWRCAMSPAQLIGAVLVLHARVVHINSSMNPRGFWRDAVYVMCARLARRKIVYQVHGGAMDQLFPRDSFRFRVLKRVLRAADVVVVLSYSEGHVYERIVGREKLYVIPNAVPFCVELRRFSLEPGELRLVFLGRLVEEKGVHELLDAARLLVERGAPFHLVIAGSGPEEGRLTARIRELGLAGVVELAGAVFGEAKASLWRQSDVFVFPSHTEKLPYSLLEAMAFGVVPVVTNVGAIEEVMQHGVHGEFVPVNSPVAIADAVERLQKDPELRARYGTAAQERIAASYTMPRFTSQFRSLYASMIRGS